MKFQLNAALESKVNDIAEVAGYLWQREWAERNGGNISVNITELVDSANDAVAPMAEYPLPIEMPLLAGNYFYVTGTGCRMRNVGRKPYEHGSIIRVSAKGDSYGVVGVNNVKPTSELPSHLAIHESFVRKGNGYKVVVHTHPTELIAMTHIERFNNDWKVLSQALWGMLPETFILVPKGLGIVPYDIPGTMSLAYKTLEQLEKHDYVMWEKHGIVGVGDDVIEVFDLIDTLSKSAKVYFTAKQAGFEPTGMTEEQINGLIEPFGIKL